MHENKNEVKTKTKCSFRRVIVKTEPQEVKPSTPSPNNVHEKPTTILTTIKIEHTDPSDNEDDDKHSTVGDSNASPSLNKPYQLDATNIDSSISTKTTPNTNSISLTAATINADTDTTRYCHVCDIKFTYHNTFIAHKQFYCKTIRNDLDGTAAPAATAVISKARASPNQASVVT